MRKKNRKPPFPAPGNSILQRKGTPAIPGLILRSYFSTKIFHQDSCLRNKKRQIRDYKKNTGLR